MMESWDDTPCIHHTDRQHRDGYGQVYKGRVYVGMSHRIAYEEEVGDIPEGLVLDHLCRNRWCVNTRHLEPVTIGENVLRGETGPGINSRKTECIRGHSLVDAYVSKDGKRSCRVCRLAYQKKYDAKRRAAAKVA